MDGQSRKLTRRELYDLVWKTPVDILGKQFGLSGRGLSKICERYSIPVPPRGYWAKARTGKRVVRPPLLEIDAPSQAEPKVPLTPTLLAPAAAEPTEEAIRYEALRQQLLAEMPPLVVPAMDGQLEADTEQGNTSHLLYGGGRPGADPADAET